MPHSGTAHCAALLVLCIELADTGGPSITHAATVLAHEVWLREGQPDSFTWIEHDPASVAPRGETFAQVTFERTRDGGFQRPVWHARTRAQVEARLGQPVIVERGAGARAARNE